MRNKYILIIVNAATKYVVACAIPNKTAIVVARTFLVNYLLIYGFPFEIFSDQGSEFIADVFKELCALLGITKIFSSAYHPNSNGQVERKIAFLKSILRTISKPDQSNWDRMLAFAVFAMNTTVPRGFLHTPFFLTFGVNHLSILDVVNGFKPQNKSIDEWYKGLIIARKVSAYLDEKVRWESKDKHDLNVTQNNIPVTGDLVLVKFKSPVGASKSLTIKQQGPFRILDVNRGTAKLQNVHCDDIIYRNAIHLTKYIQGEEEILDDFEYDVDQIVEERKINGEILYRIRWKGFGPDDDSWRSEEELVHFQELLKDWKLSKKNNGKEVIDTKFKKSNIKWKKGVYLVNVILKHEEKRKTYRFYCECNNKDNSVELKWLNQGQIGNQEIVESYLKENSLPNKNKMLNKKYNQGEVLDNDN